MEGQKERIVSIKNRKEKAKQRGRRDIRERKRKRNVEGRYKFHT